MRIDKDTRTQLHAVISPFDTAEARARYVAGQFPRAEYVRDLDTRYRWDLFFAARGYMVLPDNVTDAHIDTALRRIVPPLNNGKDI